MADENNCLHMAGYWYLCNKTIVKKMRFCTLHALYAPRLLDVYFICGKNCAFYGTAYH